MSGNVLWITGLSGAGKTTLGGEVVGLLRSAGKSVVFLDGDDLRDVFVLPHINQDNHSRERRIQLAIQYSQLCKMLSTQGLIVVIATISLFHEVHAWNRTHIPGYIEIYLNVPLDELRRRDPKNIYQKYDNGELSNVAGLDLHVDVPKNPDKVIEFDSKNFNASIANDLLKLLP